MSDIVVNDKNHMNKSGRSKISQAQLNRPGESWCKIYDCEVGYQDRYQNWDGSPFFNIEILNLRVFF